MIYFQRYQVRVNYTNQIIFQSGSFQYMLSQFMSCQRKWNRVIGQDHCPIHIYDYDKKCVVDLNTLDNQRLMLEISEGFAAGRASYKCEVH